MIRRSPEDYNVPDRLAFDPVETGAIVQGPNPTWEQSVMKNPQVMDLINMLVSPGFMIKTVANAITNYDAADGGVMREFGDKSVSGDAFIDSLISNFGNNLDGIPMKLSEANYPGSLEKDVWEGRVSWDQGGPVSIDPEGGGHINKFLTPEAQRILVDRIKNYGK